MQINPKCITLSKEKRLYQMDRPIIGLTGGIATGKSTVSNILIEKGLPVICADKLIKEIYTENETLHFIKNLSPTVLKNDEVNFSKLRDLFFSNKEIKREVESFLYSRLPNIFKEKFLQLSGDFIIYDVPLLFEKKLDSLIDTSICVYSPREAQIKRIEKRDSSSKETIENILNQQIDIETKKDLADFVIDNSTDFENLERNIEKVLEKTFL